MNKKFIVTIGRQFGSGGSEVGYRLAQELGVKYYDKDLITKAAKNSRFDEHVFEKEDEKATGSFLYSLVLAPHAAASHYLNWGEESLNERIYRAQADFMRKEAEEGSCVFVGRCADYLFWNEPNVFRVFLHADLEYRKKRIAAEGDLTPEKAEDVIRKKDKARANYYNFHTNNRWTDLTNYDMCLNVSKTGIAEAVHLIKEMVELRFGEEE